MLHSTIEEKLPRGRPRTRWMDQIRKDIEMEGNIGKNTKTGSGRIETARDFSVLVDLYLLKWLKNDDEEAVACENDFMIDIKTKLWKNWNHYT